MTTRIETEENNKESKRLASDPCLRLPNEQLPSVICSGFSILWKSISLIEGNQQSTVCHQSWIFNRTNSTKTHFPTRWEQWKSMFIIDESKYSEEDHSNWTIALQISIEWSQLDGYIDEHFFFLNSIHRMSVSLNVISTDAL